jgi:hypothetical protein
VWVLTGAQGLVVLDRVTVASGSSTAIPRSILGQAGRLPLVVSADHPVLVLADMGPTAGDGVVSLAGAGAPAL